MRRLFPNQCSICLWARISVAVVIQISARRGIVGPVTPHAIRLGIASTITRRNDDRFSVVSRPTVAIPWPISIARSVSVRVRSCGDSAAQTPLTEGQIGSWGQMPFQKSRNVAHRLLRLRNAVVPFKNMPQPLPDLQINLYTAFSKAA